MNPLLRTSSAIKPNFKDLERDLTRDCQQTKLTSDEIASLSHALIEQWDEIRAWSGTYEWKVGSSKDLEKAKNTIRSVNQEACDCEEMKVFYENKQSILYGSRSNCEIEPWCASIPPKGCSGVKRLAEESVCTEAGILNGKFELYGNGEKALEGLCKNGKKEGQWIAWNGKMNVAHIDHYEQEKKEGLSIECQDGLKTGEYLYKDDVRDGPSQAWDEFIHSEGKYKEGKLDGVQTQWFLGKKRSETTYKDGKQVEIKHFEGTGENGIPVDTDVIKDVIDGRTLKLQKLGVVVLAEIQTPRVLGAEKTNRQNTPKTASEFLENIFKQNSTVNVDNVFEDKKGRKLVFLSQPVTDAIQSHYCMHAALIGPWLGPDRKTISAERRFSINNALIRCEYSGYEKIEHSLSPSPCPRA